LNVFATCLSIPSIVLWCPITRRDMKRKIGFATQPSSVIVNVDR